MTCAPSSPLLSARRLSLSNPASPAEASEASSVASASWPMDRATSLTRSADVTSMTDAPVILPMASANPLNVSTRSLTMLMAAASTGLSTCPMFFCSSSMAALSLASAPLAVFRLAVHDPISSLYSDIRSLAMVAFLVAWSMLADHTPADLAASSKVIPAISFWKASSLPLVATSVIHWLIWSSLYHFRTADRSYLRRVSSCAYSSAMCLASPEAVRVS